MSLINDIFNIKMESQKKFVIMKKIAKHGSQAIIVVPRMLEQHLKPGTITQITIEILDQNNQNTENKEELTK